MGAQKRSGCDAATGRRCAWLALCWAALLLLGCDIDGAEERSRLGLVPVPELPWPRLETLPACAPVEDGGRLPELEPPTGDVSIDISAPLIPVGVEERLVVTILEPDTGEPDRAGNGTVTLSAPLMDTVSAAVEGGEADVAVRFSGTGRAVLTARFEGADGALRQGRREVGVFETRLPVWELVVDEADLEAMTANPHERIKKAATLTVGGVRYGTEVRIHGGSSRYYPKKSFRFDLDKGLALPNTHDHLILRAEWNDKSLLRNYLGLAMFRSGTWLPTSDAEMVHFRINGRYYGVMWQVERIGGDFLRLRGLNKDTCSLYEADPPSECWMPGGDLTPLPDLETYRCVYDRKRGPGTYDDLIDFIEGTLQLDDVAFGEAITSVIDVDAYLAYLATMAIISNADHIKKNYYMYRDPSSADSRWIFLPWDLELTFGHVWTEENGVLDEAIRADLSPEFTGFSNRLIEKLFVHPIFLTRYYDLMGHILSTVFTHELLSSHIDHALCMGLPDILADGMKRASNEEYSARVDEILQYAEARRDYLGGIL